MRGALTVLIALAAVVALVTFFVSRDEPDVTPVAPAGPGRAFPDQGARHLRPGERSPAPPNSDPPTSGPHLPAPVRRSGVALSDDQLLHAIEQGNVVVLHDPGEGAEALRRLAEQTTGPFDPALAAGGQAVIVSPRGDVDGVVAVSWRHLQRAPSADDPALRRFVEFWLGRGREG